MKTCADPEGTTCELTETAEEGCFCQTGMLWNGEECILESHCGCVYEGSYHSVRTSISNLSR